MKTIKSSPHNLRLTYVVKTEEAKQRRIFERAIEDCLLPALPRPGPEKKGCFLFFQLLVANNHKGLKDRLAQEENYEYFMQAAIEEGENLNCYVTTQWIEETVDKNKDQKKNKFVQDIEDFRENTELRKFAAFLFSSKDLWKKIDRQKKFIDNFASSLVILANDKGFNLSRIDEELLRNAYDRAEKMIKPSFERGRIWA